MSCQFGDSFPLESIKNVIEIVRSGEIEQKKWKLVKEICCGIGTAANMMDDDEIPNDLMGSGNLSEEEALQKLEDIVAGQENEELMQAIPWLVIIKILLPILIQTFGDEAVPRD
jgi:hypothetical protein